MNKLLTYGVLALTFTAAAFNSYSHAQEDAKKDKPTVAEVPAAAPIPTATPKVRPLSVTVDLLSNTAIKGTLTDLSNLDMQTSFGTANIPLSEVAAIRFASADDATTTVVMLNGDSITGATDVKLVTVETEWGTASINGQSVKSIMFVPNVVWNADSGLNGKRWILVNEKEAAAPAPGRGPATSVQPIRNPDGSLSYPTGSVPAGTIRTGR